MNDSKIHLEIAQRHVAASAALVEKALSELRLSQQALERGIEQNRRRSLRLISLVESWKDALGCLSDLMQSPVTSQMFVTTPIPQKTEAVCFEGGER